ncbi:hypothetical protein TKV_c03040 [Thermoanaerobacter kivui]|uniref:DUF2281 domain-containing protein n=1 Tax=Thermoanaerobacter kivui TaxID=2325 RepID=A0A097ANV0_THEKI|nr:hypothetical protein [Thermoanaerobacter kivui]AIS51509.1 hypothetical protein TKV_c03040 [Thermoanaerobacter kivui]
MDNAVKKKAKEYIDKLPEGKVREVIDFMEYLSEKIIFKKGDFYEKRVCASIYGRRKR